MGIDNRKQKEKEIRRNDIIDAAEAVFFSKGYSSATMDDVAKKAEFSKRTVYVYFNSKQQLYFEIMLRGYKLLNHLIEQELQQFDFINQSISRIKQLGKVFYKFSREYPDYFKAIMDYETGELDFTNGNQDQSREECYAEGEKILDYLKCDLTQGVRNGSLRDIDVVSTALILWACTIGIFTTIKNKANYIENIHHKKTEDIISTSFEMLMRSIQKNTI